ncbi:MAG: GNAT family N-acetyltransferase [Clostridia bacterium]|nr:GNAT family N-acetyltransferase [Clostridia bacterium]
MKNYELLSSFYKDIGELGIYEVTENEEYYTIKSDNKIWPKYVFPKLENINAVWNRRFEIMEKEDQNIIYPDLNKNINDVPHIIAMSHSGGLGISDYKYNVIEVKSEEDKEKFSYLNGIFNKEEITNMIESNKFKFYYIDGNPEPSAVAFTHIKDNRASIYGLYTNKGCRKMGVGRCIMEYIMDDMYNKYGIEEIHLQSTEMGYSLYEKLRYKALFNYYKIRSK